MLITSRLLQISLSDGGHSDPGRNSSAAGAEDLQTASLAYGLKWGFLNNSITKVCLKSRCISLQPAATILLHLGEVVDCLKIN
ncbi:hypothetical protein GDO81_012480 [Engystomops pustulosus]|uniref:Uncharacterized protein n=1 Tax=Engystomops pustulosus TaxID=76066 RepID=A0AAV7BMJ5_ENGPU|nr:hypothetical protein GDO81_012480 [Engystomops pustulosus]